MEELNPLLQEIVTKPFAFAGGFVSGLLRLDPASDPLMGVVTQKKGFENPFGPSNQDDSDDNGNGPQTIDIE